jgi:aldehyde dehydrogenase (NAD+)
MTATERPVHHLFSTPWTYAASVEKVDRSRVPASITHVIGGERIAGNGASMDVLNPATDEVLTSFVPADQDMVDRAVAAAVEGARNWQAMPPLERGKCLYALSRLLQEHNREFAIWESLNNGKPIKESRNVDIPLAAAHFFYHAGWTDKIDYVMRGAPWKPYGVVGQIIPWNFPLLMAAWKIAPALACGNAVVLKPAETTPITAWMLMDLIKQAGIPDGVVNLVLGAGQTGEAIANHPDVRKVAFTGSTGVGKKLAAGLAGSGKALTLELGGKGAHIVFDDASLHEAVEGIVSGIFYNQGEVCCAGSRLLVQESIAESFVARLVERIAQIRVGDPLDKNTDMGAIASRRQVERICSYVDEARAAGAIITTAPTALPQTGAWVAPTIVSGVDSSWKIVREEVFGPVLAVTTFRTADEAVEMANNTRYGLSAGVWTSSTSRWLAMSQALNAGVIWGNTFNRFDPASPFGGFKESGYGREGGLAGLRAYVEVGA